MFFSCKMFCKPRSQRLIDTSPCPYHMVIDIIIKKFLEKGPFIDENQYSIEKLWNLLWSAAAGSHSAFSKAAGVGVIAILREHHQIKVRNGDRSFPLHCYILSLMSLFFECVYIFQSPRTLFSFFFFTYLFLPWPHVHFLVTGSEILPDTARIPLSVKLHKCLYLSLSLSNLTTLFF